MDMMSYINKLKKYFNIYIVFIKNCLAAQLEYRANFVFSIFVELIWGFSHLLYVIVILKTGIVINGLSHQAMLMFIGTYFIMIGVYMGMFFTNFGNIPQYIQSGQLDIYITKPVSLQFLTTMRYINFGYPIPDIILGVSMIVIGWGSLGTGVSLFKIIGFVAFLLCSFIWVYVLQIIPSICSFWVVKTSSIFNISYSLFDMNKMPMGIYNKHIQRIGVFIIPFFPMANYPTLFVAERLSTLEIIWGIAAPFLFLGLIRAIWKKAVKRYASASS